MSDKMKKFIATHEQFEGEIEFRYDLRGILYSCIIRADIKPEVVQWMFKHAPLVPDALKAWKGQQFQVVEIPEDISFEAFWALWPEQKKDRYRAELVWKRMSIKDKVRAIWVLPAYARWCQRNPYKNPKSPASWLNEKHYNNEYNKL